MMSFDQLQKMIREAEKLGLDSEVERLMTTPVYVRAGWDSGFAKPYDVIDAIAESPISRREAAMGGIAFANLQNAMKAGTDVTYRELEELAWRCGRMDNRITRVAMTEIAKLVTVDLAWARAA